MAFAITLPVSTAMAQHGPSTRLGNPRTGAAADVVVPPPPSYVEQRGELTTEVGEDAGVPDAEIQTRLRALDATWMTLATTGGPNWGSFVLSLVGGAVQLGLGVFLVTQGAPFDQLAPMMFVFGGIGIVTPIVKMLMRPDASGPAMRYQNMPDATRAEAVARMRYGEQQLEAYAQGHFILRMVDASISVASAIAMGAIYVGTFNLDFENPITYLMLLAPAITLVNGIITFASPSAAEQRWSLYQQMRQQLRQRRQRGEDVSPDEVPPPPPTGSLSFGLAPDPRGGAFGMLTGTF